MNVRYVVRDSPEVTTVIDTFVSTPERNPMNVQYVVRVSPVATNVIYIFVSIVEKRTYKCTVCGNHYSWKDNLDMHVRTYS